jgi:hypothetical protein
METWIEYYQKEKRFWETVYKVTNNSRRKTRAQSNIIICNYWLSNLEKIENKK